MITKDLQRLANEYMDGIIEGERRLGYTSHVPPEVLDRTATRVTAAMSELAELAARSSASADPGVDDALVAVE